MQFGNYYLDDVDGNELFTEIEDCSIIVKSQINMPKNSIQLLKFIISYGEDVFPN